MRIKLKYAGNVRLETICLWHVIKLFPSPSHPSVFVLSKPLLLANMKKLKIYDIVRVTILKETLKNFSNSAKTGVFKGTRFYSGSLFS